MNVKVPKLTTVTPTLCVRTLKDPMSAAVLKALREMVKSAQVKYSVLISHSISHTFRRYSTFIYITRPIVSVDMLFLLFYLTPSMFFPFLCR